jgi:hypothetical protein
MANPILRIKQGNVKPGNYSVIAGSGLTAGELGANLTGSGSYGFYIGNTFGQAITFGCEVTTDSAFTTPSDAKIPTQKALKTYVDALSVSASPVGIISRYSGTALDPDGNLLVSANTPTTQLFASSEFTQTIAITDLTYSNGTFTNNSGNIMYLLVTYQITWIPPTNISLNFNAVKGAWIQKTFINSVPADNVYGFTSLLLQPTLSTLAGAIRGTQNGSAIIALAAGDSFSIQCRSSVTTNTTSTATINITGTSATNFTRATRIQIVRL